MSFENIFKLQKTYTSITELKIKSELKKNKFFFIDIICVPSKNIYVYNISC